MVEVLEKAHCKAWNALKWLKIFINGKDEMKVALVCKIKKLPMVYGWKFRVLKIGNEELKYLGKIQVQRAVGRE